MSYRIDIQRLNKQELIYELKIRGFVDVGNVEQMRDCLRNLIRLKNTENSLTYPECELVFDDEYKIIDGKIKEIFELVEELDTGRKSGPALKVETKIAHILKRCDRLKTVGDDHLKQKSVLLTRIMTAISKYESKISEVESRLDADIRPSHASTPRSATRIDSPEDGEHSSNFLLNPYR